MSLWQKILFTLPECWVTRWSILSINILRLTTSLWKRDLDILSETGYAVAEVWLDCIVTVILLVFSTRLSWSEFPSCLTDPPLHCGHQSLGINLTELRWRNVNKTQNTQVTHFMSCSILVLGQPSIYWGIMNSDSRHSDSPVNFGSSDLNDLVFGLVWCVDITEIFWCFYECHSKRIEIWLLQPNSILNSFWRPSTGRIRIQCQAITSQYQDNEFGVNKTWQSGLVKTLKLIS